MRRWSQGLGAGMLQLLALGAVACGGAPGTAGDPGADPAASADPTTGAGAAPGARGAAARGDGGAGVGPLTGYEAVAHPVAPALAGDDGGVGGDAVADGAAVFPSSTADSDGDGVPDALDFCPGTSAGTTVDSVGCGAQERAALSMVTLTLDPQAKLPIVLQAPAADVQYTTTGAVVGGSLLLETPLGEVPMFGAHVTFGYAPGTSDIVTVAGTVQVPLPHDGRFGKFSIDTPALAQIGYGPGSGVTQEAGDETPIQPTTKYLYFDTTGGFGVKYGSTMSIDGPGGSQRIFLDPSDPFLFAEGQVTGIPKIGNVALGFGISGHGNLDFKPTFPPNTPTEITEKVQPFNADLLLTGHVPLAELPLAIEGEVYYGVTTDDQGTPTHVNIGANDTLLLSFDFLDKLVGAEIPIAQATFGASLGQGTDTAFFSGVVMPDAALSPPWVPLTYTESLAISGVVSTDVTQTLVTATGTVGLVGSSLASMCGVDLKDLAVAQATVGIDHSGFHVSGSATSTISGKISLDAVATVTSFFGGDPDAWYLQMMGNVAVEGFHLGAARTYIDHTGLALSGTLRTPVSSITLDGSITRSGVDLEGDASINIPISNAVTTTITDAAQCGYENGETLAECTGNIIEKCAKAIWHGHSCKKPKCVPKSCNETVVQSLGNVQGSVHLALGDAGIQGTLKAQYCLDGSCEGVSGSVDVTPGTLASIKVCVPSIPSISVAGGPYCTSL